MVVDDKDPRATEEELAKKRFSARLESRQTDSDSRWTGRKAFLLLPVANDLQPGRVEEKPDSYVSAGLAAIFPAAGIDLQEIVAGPPGGSDSGGQDLEALTRIRPPICKGPIVVLHLLQSHEIG